MFDFKLSESQLSRLIKGANDIVTAVTQGLRSIADTNRAGFDKVADSVANLQTPEPPPARLHGYARVITDTGTVVGGDIVMSRITDTGWAEFTFVPTDKAGNPTDSYQKGTEKHTIVNDDGTLAEIVPSVISPDDPLSFRVNAKGPVGAVQLLSSVDGDPSADVENIIEASGAIEIVPGNAVRGELKEGATGEQ